MICPVENCQRQIFCKGYCEPHYRRFAKHGNPLGGRTPFGEPLKFVNELILNETNECVLWPYATGDDGYGTVVLKGKTVRVHRYICTEINGDPEDDSVCCHSCGNGHLGCVTPKHLRWGDQIENWEDRKYHQKYGRKKINT